MLSVCILVAQTGEGMTSPKKVNLNSKVLNEERVITIKLPRDYNLTDHKYPVVYILDGKTHFRHATGAVDFLSRNGNLPDMIIVSVHNVDRNRDFSPVYHESVPTSGGAEDFLVRVV